MNKLFALVFFLGGVLLLANVAFPIFSYELTKAAWLDQQLLFPMSEKGAILGQSAQNLAVLAQTSKNLVSPSNWFENNQDNLETKSSTKFYTVSIPQLKIDKASVEVSGEDLSKNLVQYPGTALPGKSGNTVIFGHSVLPQFFNPKNYLTIFSTLPTIKKGDEIIVDYDGITYKYKVSELFEVSPKAIEVLRQYHDGPHLTLITCVPPGTYLRRLVVRANLVPEI